MNGAAGPFLKQKIFYNILFAQQFYAVATQAYTAVYKRRPWSNKGLYGVCLALHWLQREYRVWYGLEVRPISCPEQLASEVRQDPEQPCASRSLEQGKDPGGKSLLGGIFKEGREKDWFFCVVGKGQREGELKVGRETLWEDKAMDGGVEALWGDGLQQSSRPSAVSWFYLLTK